jgi:hypothetical protein
MAASIRPGVMSMIFALPCAESVITPAWEPVNDVAVWPSWAIAIASSAIEIRSPRSAACRARAAAAAASPAREVAQLVGGVAHRGDDHDDVVARPSAC